MNTTTREMAKGFGLAVVILVAMSFAIGLAMLSGSFVIATAGAMFFHHGFWDGFHVAWDQPGYLSLFSLLLLPILRVKLTGDSK